MHQKNNKKEIDLGKSLKESAVKSQGGQRSSEPYVSPGAPKIIRLVIKYSGGLIKNERQAAYVLLGFIALAVIISIFLFLNILSSPQVPPGALEQPEYGLPIKD